MHENEIIAAILTVAVNARTPHAPSREVGAEDRRHVIEDYNEFLRALKEHDNPEDKVPAALRDVYDAAKKL